MNASRASINSRGILAAALAVLALILFLLHQPARETPDERAQGVRRDLRSVNAVVDTLLLRHGIGKDQVRSWQVKTPDRKFIRTERQVRVSPDFISVKFNHALNRALEGTGARVVATERTKENTVTIHIKSGPTIIESITFVVSRKPAAPVELRNRKSFRKNQ